MYITIQEKSLPLWHMVAADCMLVAAACLVPAASHVAAVPLYMLNPMLALLLAGLWLGRKAGMEMVNGLSLAVVMPVVSSLLVGMPVVEKLPCMVAELLAVAGVFVLFVRRMPAWVAVLSAVVCGKAVYYGMKAMLVPAAGLVGTDWWVQAGAVALWCGLFAVVYRKNRV